jgi:hypothetical protein
MIPPNDLIGQIAKVTKDILHENTNANTIPIINPKPAYIRIAIVSVVSPFNRVISSANTLVNTPGALSFESNQLISL